jgi:UDP-3-O-[3-hydroxymyristoyl] N-acetylglucosamine deacetylase
MQETQQCTLHNAIRCVGIGLHTGKPVTMTLVPAPVNTGIIFLRTDIGQEQGRIRALYDRVTDTRLGTTISNSSGISVSTIEHLMAAFSGCNISNIIVEIDGPEVPIMDGSADPFVFLIECAGIEFQECSRYAVRLLKKIKVTEGDKSVTLSPSDHFSMDFRIDFPSKAIGVQEMSVALSNTFFKTELSRARTFGFVQEVETLRKHGLAVGGSLDNAIVIDGDTVLNEEGLRYSTEFVRHKILDAIGDLYLSGYPLIAHYEGIKAGHELNNRALKELFSDDLAWELVALSSVNHFSLSRGALSELSAQSL